jgi:hypothetical protein
MKQPFLNAHTEERYNRITQPSIKRAWDIYIEAVKLGKVTVQVDKKYPKLFNKIREVSFINCRNLDISVNNETLIMTVIDKGTDWLSLATNRR